MVTKLVTTQNTSYTNKVCSSTCVPLPLKWWQQKNCVRYSLPKQSESKCKSRAQKPNRNKKVLVFIGEFIGFTSTNSFQGFKPKTLTRWNEVHLHNGECLCHRREYAIGAHDDIFSWSKRSWVGILLCRMDRNFPIAERVKSLSILTAVIIMTISHQGPEKTNTKETLHIFHNALLGPSCEMDNIF